MRVQGELGASSYLTVESRRERERETGTEREKEGETKGKKNGCALTVPGRQYVLRRSRRRRRTQPSLLLAVTTGGKRRGAKLERKEEGVRPCMPCGAARTRRHTSTGTKEFSPPQVSRQTRRASQETEKLLRRLLR